MADQGTSTATPQSEQDKSGGVIPDLDELKLCIRKIKDENPEQGIAKARKSACSSDVTCVISGQRNYISTIHNIYIFAYEFLQNQVHAAVKAQHPDWQVFPIWGNFALRF
jgi:hypothetical protein